MCGIYGSIQIGPASESDNKEIASRCVQTLHHRGPDNQTVFHDASSGLTLGHARLSIIGLDNGEQPIVDDRTILCANGEFYDYKRIRGELVAKGFDFNTKSDSEIASKLYQLKGLDFFNDLRGEFAFSLYDRNRDELILARDRFGIRPLFYGVFGDVIIFASEIKAILAHPKVKTKISKKAAAHQMMQVMVPGDTLFEGIRAVKPGTFLRIKKSSTAFEINEKVYWDVEFPTQDAYPKMSDAEAIELCQTKLIESVAHRLEADVPVACYLSGGIDSCSILGLASAVQQSAVKAFTIQFDDARYDETHIAKIMAERVKADHDILDVQSDHLYGDNYLKTVWHSERTFYNTLGVAKYLMSRRVNECQYKVVVTGEGSDELLGGYTAFKKDMLLHGMNDSGALMKELQEKNKLFSGSVISDETIEHPKWNEVVGFTPSWFQPWLGVYAEAEKLFSSEMKKELSGYDPAEEIANHFDQSMLKERHALDKAQYTWIKTMLEGQILNWGGDRVDMAHSMESRPAFLDHHFAEAVIRIHPDKRVRNGVEKWVLREAMKNILPKELYEREKFSFMAPPAHTEEKKMKNLRALIDQYLSPGQVEALGVFDPNAVTHLIEEYQKPSDHSLQTRQDILINHLLGLHILNQDDFLTTPSFKTS